MRKRWFFMTLLLTGSFFFVVNLAPPGWAGPPEGKRGTMPKEAPDTRGQSPGDVKVKFWCPKGWKKAEVTDEKYTCKPKRPPQMRCPEGWHYDDTLHNKCTTSGLGNVVGGCRIGCYKTPDVPK